MTKEKEAVAITGKSQEEVAYNLFAEAMKIGLIGKGGFENYKGFLEQYKRALRAVDNPYRKTTDIE